MRTEDRLSVAEIEEAFEASGFGEAVHRGGIKILASGGLTINPALTRLLVESVFAHVQVQIEFDEEDNDE